MPALDARIPMAAGNIKQGLSIVIENAQKQDAANRAQQGLNQKQQGLDLQKERFGAAQAQATQRQDTLDAATQNQAIIGGLNGLLELPEDRRALAAPKVIERLNQMGTNIPAEDLSGMDFSDTGLRSLITGMGGEPVGPSKLDIAKTAKFTAEAATESAGVAAQQIPQELIQNLDPVVAEQVSAAFTASGGGDKGVKAAVKMIESAGESQRRAAGPEILKARFPQASADEMSQLQATLDSAKTSESGMKAAVKLRETQRQVKKGAAFKQTAVDLLDRILANPELDDVIGSREGRDLGLPIPFVDEVHSDGEMTAIADIEEASNILTADNLDIMTGVLSETDIKIISNLASGGLNRVRGEVEFKRRVQELRDKIANSDVLGQGGAQKFNDQSDDELMSF